VGPEGREAGRETSGGDCEPRKQGERFANHRLMENVIFPKTNKIPGS
jgi:hypothetical protein